MSHILQTTECYNDVDMKAALIVKYAVTKFGEGREGTSRSRGCACR